jgi:hypothetical protein
LSGTGTGKQDNRRKYTELSATGMSEVIHKVNQELIRETGLQKEGYGVIRDIYG